MFMTESKNVPITKIQRKAKIWTRQCANFDRIVICVWQVTLVLRFCQNKVLVLRLLLLFQWSRCFHCTMLSRGPLPLDQIWYLQSLLWRCLCLLRGEAELVLQKSEKRQNNHQRIQIWMTEWQQACPYSQQHWMTAFQKELKEIPNTIKIYYM